MSSGNAPKQRLQMKIRILQALETLLESKEYSSIEINEICQVAHISKPTFYRYFKNKDNIFRWVTKVGLRVGLVEIGRRYTWYEGYLISLMVAYRHRVFFSEKQKPELIASIIDFAWHYQYEALSETYTHRTGKDPDERLSYLLETTARTQFLMTRRWCTEGMRIAPERMAAYLADGTPCKVFEFYNKTITSQE